MKKWISIRLLVEEKSNKKVKELVVSSKDYNISLGFADSTYKKTEPRIEVKVCEKDKKR